MDKVVAAQIGVAILSGSVVRRAWGVQVALQVEILLVLSGHPGGRATVADLNADLTFFAGAGPEWSQRMKRLAANAPGLDIFTEGYVIRDPAGWSITDAGRTALQRMDRPIETRVSPTADPAPSEAPTPARPAVVIIARGQPTAQPPARTAMPIPERRRLPRSAT